MRRRGAGRFGIVVAVCALVLSLIGTDLASGAGAATSPLARRARSTVQLQAAHAGRPSGSAVRLERKLKPKPKKKVKRKPAKKKAAKKKKKKKTKKAAGSSTQRSVMWLAFAAIAGLGLFLIFSSVRNGPRARARARERQRLRRPATR